LFNPPPGVAPVVTHPELAPDVVERVRRSIESEAARFPAGRDASILHREMQRDLQRVASDERN
jgi:hypothetical protein